MSLHLAAVTVDALDPEALSTFWATLLSQDPAVEEDGIFVLSPGGGTEFRVEFAPTDEPKSGPNRMHFDLPSASAEDQQHTVQRALALGARHLDVGQLPIETHVVLADPEGNEFCVIAAGNRFLVGSGPIGALACDGTRAVGLFWRAALDWPLVWDQDEETAIEAPHSGTRISWGGPPVAPKHGKNRWHLCLAPPAGGDQRSEVERLRGLGAHPVDIGQGEVPWAVLADPDGNEFCVLTPR